MIQIKNIVLLLLDLESFDTRLILALTIDVVKLVVLKSSMWMVWQCTEASIGDQVLVA